MKSSLTLVEIGVVLVVIVLVVGIAVPMGYRFLEKAKVQKAINDMNSIAMAAMQHLEDTGQFPPAINTPPYGDGFLTNNNNYAGWSGPYLEEWPQHAWHKGVSDPTSYQWDFKDADNDGQNEWCVEIGLGDVNSSRRNFIAGMIDEKKDDGDGPCAGIFQAYCPPGPSNWATWPKLIVMD